ncbi:hypothetical protein B0H13DRAFT_1591296, partial [Mycena leptocephala]
TGKCDGWKSNARASIITTSVTVEGKAHSAIPDLAAIKKSAKNLLKIVLEDMKYCEGELGIIMIRYCTDNGGDARGMRIRLKRMKPKLVVPPCWGHQVRGGFR